MTVLGAIAPRLMIPMRMVAKMRTLVNDETLLDLLMRDTTSAGSRVQLGFVASMIRARPRVEPEQFTRCPVLLVHPSQDRWVDVRLSRIFYDRLACPKRLVMVDGAGHLPCAMPGLRIMRDAVFEFARDVT
jgi:alpha-beta hydrolase superfamily lysophospholipase